MLVHQNFHHGTAIWSLEDRVPLFDEYVADDGADCRFVVDDENFFHEATSSGVGSGAARPVRSPEDAANGPLTVMPCSPMTNSRIAGSVPVWRALRTETKRCKDERSSTWRSKMPLSIVADAAGTGTTS